MSTTPILVTGAAGVVGSHTVRQLRERGAAVVAADILPGPGPLLDGLDGLEYRRIDIQDLAQVLDVLRDVRSERVVHLAALVGDWYNRHPLANHTVNVGGFLNVLEACRLSGVRRLVFASTWSLYPEFHGTQHGHPDYVPVPEDTPPLPVRPYEIGKYSCERMAAWFNHVYGLEFAALRFGGYYAAERRFHKEPRGAGPLTDMLMAAAFRRPFHLETGGDQGFDAVHVKDCAHGCVCAALATATPGGIYNVGTGQAATLRRAAEILRELAPESKIEVGPGLLSVKHYCRLDVGRARRELAYSPRFPLREGLADCLAEIRRVAVA